MSNLKDTDIDDLFRRASDKYPLRTDSVDWDKMAAALERDPTPAGFDGTGAGDKRRKRRFFWLLLILPLGGAGYYTWFQTGHGPNHPTIAVVAAPDNRQGAGVQENTIQKAGQRDISAANGEQAGKGDAVGQMKDGDRRVKGTDGGQVKSADGQVKGTDGGQVKSADGHLKGADGHLAGSKGSLNPNTGARSGDPDAGGIRSDLAGGRPGKGGKILTGGAVGTKQSYIERTTQSYVEVQPLSLKWAADMQRAHIANDYRLTVEVAAPPAAKQPDPVKKKPKASYLYAGIIGAPDLSTVKMQSIKGVGTTFGILLGYAFNERWAIETGVYVDRKKYYTDGEYFDTTHVRMPAYYHDLLNVNGTCYMWEIPLNVRYNFNPDGKTKWFGTAGLSTYLMSKEQYTYEYKKSSGAIYYNNWNIKQPSRYPFSIVSLSAGFEQGLGRVGNLRVEPYVRLPLQGIGTGKLPIMSAGVNIGITRRLW